MIYYNSAYAALHYCNDTDWVMAGIGPYNPNAINFDGNDWLSVASDLTGNADGGKITASFWFKVTNAGVTKSIFRTGNARVRIDFTGSEAIQLLMQNTSGTTVLNATTTSTYADGQWHHALIAIDMASASARGIYVDGVSQSVTWTTYTVGSTIDFTASDHGIGSVPSGGVDRFQGDLADVWIDIGTYIDFSVPANRAKFRSTSGMPMYLGMDGSIPTESAPEIFLTGDTASWETNKGSGGGFTENGALTTAASQPGTKVYAMNGVTFDGANDYLTRGADLTGNADSNKVTGSFWVRRNGGIGSVMYIQANTSARVYVTLAADNTVNIHGENTGGTAVLDLRTTSTITDANWHHILFSIDLSSTASRHIYLDGVAETLNVTTYNTAGTIDFTRNDHSIGATIAGGNKLNGDLADVWFDFGTYIDLSQPANRDKFRHSSGLPVYLGTDGSTPTGAAPEIFLTGATVSWESNQGLGGSFTENGALTDAGTAAPTGVFACGRPSGHGGHVIYNTDFRVMQYCNGVEWVAMGPKMSSLWSTASAGDNHSCGIKQDGTAWCWGNDANGQLGNGTTLTGDQAVPTLVTGGSTWKGISAGSSHSCGIKSNDSLWCWGSDTNGRLGNGATTGDQADPSAVNDGGATWKAVSAGGDHTCGIKTNNSLWCWGNDGDGQLGNGASGSQTSPFAVNDGGATWKMVSAGSGFTCGLKTNNSLWCWGRDSDEQLADGAGATSQLSPVAASDGGATWNSVSAGGFTAAGFACGLKTDNTLWCWGDNLQGQLGDGTSGTDRNVPTAVNDGGATWSVVDTGGHNACAVKSNNSVWCWGDDTDGQVGNGGTTGDQTSPVAVSGAGAAWKAVNSGAHSSSSNHVCGIKSDDSLWCWGDDTDGQVGNGDTAGDQTVPSLTVNSAGIAGSCVNPSGGSGQMFYNIDHAVMQYCNGGNWIGIGK
jgi:alpha-tubulin suppressor-like RCC1 family protein